MIARAPEPLTRPQLAAARMLGRDEEVLTRVPVGERNELLLDLFALFCLGLLELGLWTFAMMSFGVSAGLAVPSAMLVATIIMVMDIRMTSSDNEPRGELRNRRFKKVFYGYFAVRLSMCVILAAPAAIAMDLAIFRSEALEVMHKDRDDRNRGIYDEYQKKIDDLEEVGLGAARQNLEALQGQRTATLAAQRQAQSAVAASRAQQDDARLEASRQDQGLGDRDRGHGELAIDAEMRASLASELAGREQAQADRLLANVDQLQGQIVTAQAAYQRELQRLQPERSRLIAERDGRLIQATDGPLTVFQGLIKLHRDPERGAGLLFITLMVWALTMALELSFFLRLVFKPASIYDLLLTTQRKAYAAAAAHDFRQQVMGFRRRPPLRVVEVEPPIPLHQ